MFLRKLITRTRVSSLDGLKRGSAFITHTLVSCCAHSLTQLAVHSQDSRNYVYRDDVQKKRTIKLRAFVLVKPFSKACSIFLGNSQPCLLFPFNRKQKDGKYLIVKDPNKPVIRLYDIPDNTFESEESGEEEDDELDGKPLLFG